MDQNAKTDEFTIIIVHYNTPRLLERAIKSIPKNLPLIVVENGDDKHLILGDKKINTVLFPPTKMFHGDGLDFGIQHVETPYFVAMDSDAYIKDPIIFHVMFQIFSEQTYGAGSVVTIDENGMNDWHINFKPPGFPYLHPHFCMIDKAKYLECLPFVHHGAPAIYAMQSLMETPYILKHIPDLSAFIHHDGRGTRNITDKYKEGWDIR